MLATAVTRETSESNENRVFTILVKLLSLDLASSDSFSS